MYDADEILERMRNDRESDWPDRLAAAMYRRALADEPPGSLTMRERDVLRLISHGLTLGEAAGCLFLSFETCKAHMANARRKLRAKTSTHAVATAIREGLIS